MPQHKYTQWAAWALIPLCTTLSQSFMKVLARETGDLPFGVAWLQQAAHSPWALATLASEIVSFLLWMQVLAHMDVSRAVPLTSVSYVLILAASQFIFHEPLTIFQLIGGILILSGVWLISSSSGKVSS